MGEYDGPIYTAAECFAKARELNPMTNETTKPVVTQADRDMAENWAHLIDHRWSEYEGNALEDLAEDFAKHRDASAAELERGKEELRRLMECIWRAEYRHEAPNWQPFDHLAGMVGQIDNMYAGVRSQRDEARWALHNPPSPSEPSVVSQDLVPVAWRELDDDWVYYDGASEIGQHVAMYQQDQHNVSVFPLYDASAIEAAQIAARNDALDEAADKLHETIASEFKGFWDAEDLVEEIPAIIRSLRTPSQHQESEG